MLLHDGGTINGGCDVCERIAREQELARKKEIEEQELIQKMNEEMLSNSESINKDNVDLFSPLYEINGKKISREEYNEHFKKMRENKTILDLEQEISSFSESSNSNVNQGDINSVDPNAVLNNVSKSLTGQALGLGFGTALGCGAAFVPIPLIQEAGAAVCVFGGIGAAGTALTGHILEPKEPKK